MKKTFVLILCILFGRMLQAQQKTDSLQTVSWPDTITQVQFNLGVTSDPLQLILGKEPGAEVFKAGSDPNIASSMIIRGTYGSSGETHPLYVIDGIIGGDIFMVPPQEIESVKILKNLSETSFYGSEGTNGVLLVTTKRGNKTKRLKVEFNTEISLGHASGLHDLFSAQEMREKARLHPEIQFVDGGSSTDWQQEIFRTTVSQSYQIALGGTLKNTTYRASFNYIAQPGNVRSSDRNMTGGSVSLRQTALKNKLQIDGFVSYYQTKSHTISYPAARFGENLFYQAFTHNPTDPVYSPGGSSYDQSQRAYNYFNPVALVNMISNEGKSKLLNIALNAKWDIWKGLGIKVTGSYSDNNTITGYNRPAGAYPGASQFTSGTTDTYTRANLLAGITYNRCLGKKHFLDLFAGYMHRSSTNGNEMYGYHAGSTTGDTSRANIRYKDYGLLATLNYNFRQKYFLGLVLNQEHYESDVTRQQNGSTLGWGQWVFYPGITASWEIGREEFMRKIKPLSTLTLKVSYGIAGVRPDAAYISEYNAGYNNQNLMTEKTAEFTAGLDAGFVRNRIMVEIGYYYRNSGNRLIRETLPVPPNVVSFAYVNGMKVTNSGLEFKLSVRVIDKQKISWNSILGFSMNKNKVVSIDDDLSYKSGYIDYYFSYTDSPYILTTGSGNSELSFSLPVSQGYYQGQPLYERKDGGFTNNVNEAKREITDKVFPDFILSWTNSFNLFKKFDVSLMFRYVAGHRIFNGTRMLLSTPDYYLTLNTLPEAESNYDDGVLRIPFSDKYLENASYLRLENLSVGYTFVPQNIKWKGRLRVYLAINNLFTITGYSGLDPVFNSNSPGLDYLNTYPKNKTYTVGINLEI